jgi:NAD(P)H dehydrogenase (quinone)
MYAVTGITGQVGGAVARTLMAQGENVRAVVRDAGKAASWVERGCDLAIAEMSDASALTRAFAGADGVFVLIPPMFDPSSGFTEAGAVISAVRHALKLAEQSPTRHFG